MNRPLLVPAAGPSGARSPDVEAAIFALGHAEDAVRGAVYTRAELVGFIFDLVGYTVDQPLHERGLQEPSCGDGDSLLEAVRRLVGAWRRAGARRGALDGVIRAVEIWVQAFARTRRAVKALFCEAEVPEAVAQVRLWLRQDGSLLSPWFDGLDVVVDHPPSLRQERIPAPPLAACRLA